MMCTIWSSRVVDLGNLSVVVNELETDQALEVGKMFI